MILDHLVFWPSGGFVGVDVFFVISGFLITGILLREHEKTNHISFVGFYRRRIKRIVPAATVVLIATVAASSIVFNATRYWATLWDAVWAFLFSANWRFALQDTDYFQATTAVSPLQHYWSLSVEEQFYLVWPWLMLGVLFIASKRSRFNNRRAVTGILMGVIVVASFGWALWETATNPSLAYFSTFTRAWELGIGALVAIASPWWGKIPQALRPVLGWVGLIGIIASLFVINDGLPFPAPWALLPVLMTALVIVGGTGGQQRFLWPLTNRGTTWVGDISYSLYLWHFPLIVIIGTLMEPSPLFYGLTVVLMLGLAAASYYLIEAPIHKSPLWDAYRSRSSRERAWKDWRLRWKNTYKIGGLSVLIAATLLVVVPALIFDPSTPDDASAPAYTYVPPTSTAGAQPVSALAALEREISTGRLASEWPANLSPTMDEAMAQGSEGNPALGCFAPGTMPDISACTFGNPAAPTRAFLVGDSTAMSYAPAFIELAETSGDQIAVTTIGLYGCPFVELELKNTGAGVAESCPERKAEVAAAIAAAAPQLVFVTNVIGNAVAADGSKVAMSDMVDATVGWSGRFANDATRTVYFPGPPVGKELTACYGPLSSPADCMTDVSREYKEYESLMEAKLATGGGVFVGSTQLACSRSGECPAFAGTLPMRYDQRHLTADYARHIAPAMREMLVDEGLLAAIPAA
ncbi:acyltransferase [Herbiconiux sp. SALV-R1]|uniref:acyltransferase family protein n=1 Tax=Herbiconiux sp. SALV-R1 TaxID=2735133 RepID=UPI001491EFF5|nr:acyltransferase family protein [Herbiconiux sp. SALV-R1]QJU54573.1 acyltransferase [Herbiconiux sp. SALV-R1]